MYIIFILKILFVKICLMILYKSYINKVIFLLIHIKLLLVGINSLILNSSLI